MSNSLPKETLDVLSEVSDPPVPNDRVTIVLQPKGTNKTFLIDASEDYDRHTLKVVKSYAVATIKEGGSKYQIDSNIDDNNISLRSPEGIPVGISDNAPGGDPQKTYLGSRPGIEQAAKSYFYTLSDHQVYKNSPYSGGENNNRTDVGISVVKGKAIKGPGQIDYDTEFELIPPKVGQSLISNNTYYPETNGNKNSFSTVGAPEKDTNVNRSKLQATLGSYKKTLSKQEEEVVGNQGSTGNVTLVQDDFLNMGLQLTLKGSGEYYIPKFGPNQTTDSPGVQIAAARAAALAPGAARIGLRIPVKDINPIATLDNDVLLEDKKLNRTTNFPDLQTEPINSYGSYNNWVAPFDGIDRLLQVPALAIMLGPIATTVSLIGDILQSFTGKSTYSDQVRAGFISFFGLQSKEDRYDSGSFFVAVASAITSERLINETGWYGGVIRGFVKNVFLEISRGIFAAGVTGNFNADTGILNRTGIDIYSDGINGDIVGAGAKILEQFFNSKIIGFVNMLADIGENQVRTTTNNNIAIIKPFKKGISSAIKYNNALSANQKSFIDEFVDDGTSSPRTEFGTTTSLKYSPYLKTLIAKDRLKQNNQKGIVGAKTLAWGTGTTPSMHLLPDSIKKAAYAANEQGLQKLNDYLSLGAMSNISTTDIQRFEKELESSYIPFSFQDMRTGEILSFHAFIENMSDAFQAQYESETGFGRVEPTHIYRSSSRTMRLTFIIVATNPSDHDEMWLKINKMVTFIYPQYTKGRALSVSTAGATPQTQKFIQPYSQLVGASPLVRMRVGDVWKSNYSKFNVMRLFGLGKDEFILEQNAFNQLTGSSVSENNNYNSELQRILKMELQTGDQIMISYYTGIDNRVFGTTTNTIEPPRDLQIPNLTPDLYTFRVDGVIETIPSIPNQSGPIKQFKLILINSEGGRIGGDTYILRYADPDFLNDANSNPNIIDIADAFQTRFSAFQGTPSQDMWERSVAYSSLGLKILVDYDWLRANKTGYTISNVEQTTEIRNQINNFFSSTGDASNPIMQAFENNKGKGIAGFVSSIDLDWKDSTWETEYSEQRNSSRAPMMCKISMEFLPIHDIVPGIDSDGFMTAPVYPVGRFSNVTNTVVPEAEPSTPGIIRPMGGEPIPGD